MKVTIYGAPVGKGRHRISTRGRFPRAYTPEKTRSWQTRAAEIMSAAWGKPALVVPVRVRVDAVQQRPKALTPRSAGGTLAKTSTLGLGRLWRPTKPDADNVLKAVCDALVMGGVIADDVQAVEVVARSLYGAVGEPACVVVQLELVEGEPGEAL